MNHTAAILRNVLSNTYGVASEVDGRPLRLRKRMGADLRRPHRTDAQRIDLLVRQILHGRPPGLVEDDILRRAGIAIDLEGGGEAEEDVRGPLRIQLNTRPGVQVLVRHAGHG